MINIVNITAIQHIGIPVTNIGDSQTFYERLGFKRAMLAGFMHKGHPGSCVMMKRGDMLIELYQLPEPDLNEIRGRGNGHIDHVAFNVPDIDVAFKEIKESGFTIIEPEPVFLQFWKNGCKFFNITGPDGERLEFNQIL
ncbi:VOC family protein [Mucilaginibacter achroorhodeus]|uniref:VOC family protein n=1 Tax=Mucilaginibacter achroorhodeus TaxID=2599294 RepID=A0A563U9G9_9SPHI|nr:MULTISPECIES: VOC family protein [Mucilaginibacter]QXV67100.1 VOC family protein [Mucilaginibacter sp. 21P]TWR27933.1 VOC family protein [Mucilaginibacter achroorhodeus]